MIQYKWYDINITDPFIEDEPKNCPKCNSKMIHQYQSNGKGGIVGYRWKCTCGEIDIIN